MAPDDGGVESARGGDVGDMVVFKSGGEGGVGAGTESRFVMWGAGCAANGVASLEEVQAESGGNVAVYAGDEDGFGFRLRGGMMRRGS